MDTDNCLGGKVSLYLHTEATKKRTPPGTKSSSTVSPPSGTTLGVPKDMGGKSLKISLMTAVKYGNVAFILVISLDEAYRDLTSCFSFS